MSVEKESSMKKHSLRVPVALSILLLASAAVVASAGSAPFSLVASPRTVGILPTQTAFYRVELRSIEGFSGNVLLYCRPTSPLIRCRLSHEVVHVGGEGQAILIPEIWMMASAGAATPIGVYPIQITGQSLPFAVDTLRDISRTTVQLIVHPVVDPPPSE
jgi:hypothetical protein